MTFPTFQKRLGRHLRDLRKSAGLTQEELASKAAITRQHLQRLEGGTVNPTIGTLFSIAKVFRISVGQLVGLAELH